MRLGTLVCLVALALLAHGTAIAAPPVTQLPGEDACVEQEGTAPCENGRTLIGGNTVAVSPDGENVYVSSGGGDTIKDGVAVLSLDPTNGALDVVPNPNACVAVTNSNDCREVPVQPNNGSVLHGARSVTVSPDDEHVYVVGRDSDAVVILDRNTTHGGLTPLSEPNSCITPDGNNGECGFTSADILDAPIGIALSPDGEFAYVLSGGSASVAVFDRNPVTGVLTLLAGTAGCVSEDGSGGDCADGRGFSSSAFATGSITVAPDGKSVYAALGSTLLAFSRNTTTGALTQLTGTNGCVSETGTTGDCVDGRALGGVRNVVVTPDGKGVYVSSAGAIAAFSRNTTTGVLTQLAGQDSCITPNGNFGFCRVGTGGGSQTLAVSADSTRVYVGLSFYTRNTTTNVLTQLPGTAGCISDDPAAEHCAQGVAIAEFGAVALSPDGENLYAAGGTELEDGSDIWAVSAFAIAPDGDGDGVTDSTDNCSAVFNPGQENADGDAQGNACDTNDDNDAQLDGADNCPLNANTNQANADGDSQGDVCDPDDDNDGADDLSDNCASVANPDQLNTDGDAAGNACDTDDDNDGDLDGQDNCPLNSNSDQLNTDGAADGGNACDADDDNDGDPDGADNCPLNSNSNQANNDGDSLGDVCDSDDDNDGDADGADNCPTISNSDQQNTDADGPGDACDADDDNDGDIDLGDNCPLDANPNQVNTDGDGLGDVCDPDDDNDTHLDGADNCRVNSNANQENADGANDGGDACDSDDDDDGRVDAADNCPLNANAEQQDTDGDGQGDSCDGDRDADGVADGQDNCPRESNADQRNTDGVADGGDVCDADDDADGRVDATDNCPLNANDGQEDVDGDGEGDPCDGDDDNDGDPDGVDSCPTVFDPDQADADGSGGGDVCDPDDDNDELSDTDEEARDTSPVDVDSDDDGLADGAETATSPSDSDSDNDKLQDGTELGLTSGIAAAGGVRGTDVDEFEPDADPRTKTKPDNADTDRDRLKDGVEDRNRDGKRQRKRETDPRKRDTDRDGVSDKKDRSPLSKRRR